jgi:hypothetical protein
MMNSNGKSDVCRADAEIGKRVRVQRIKCCLSLMDVAAHQEISIDDYDDAESGDYPLSVVDMIRLAQLFGANVEDLMPNERDL